MGNVRWPRIYVGWPFLTPPSGPRGQGRVRPSSDAPRVTASPRVAKGEQASSPGFAEAIFGGPNDPRPCVGAAAWRAPVWGVPVWGVPVWGVPVWGVPVWGVPVLACG